MEDILPLYVDECCSEDTKQLIEEHLLECEHCNEKLTKLKQPMFIPQETSMDEKTYAKHAKRAFGKLRRRLVISILMILIFSIPLTWLGINEVRGDGVSYSSLPYVIRGNALLESLKNGNYEKAFSYLNLKALYDWETEFEEVDLDLMYKQVKIGGDSFYIDEETYNNDYQNYLTDKDEATFWRSIYLRENYMIPVNKAELYLKDLEDIEWYKLMEYKVNGRAYYINGEYFSYKIENVGNSLFRIMQDDYYNQAKKQIKEEEKETKRIIQIFLDMGYDGYVADYKQQWINNFEQLKDKGITIEGYIITLIHNNDSRYQLDYRLKLNVNGEINNDYGVTFLGNENGFYPSGGFVSGLSMEYDRVPIISAFGHTLNWLLYND